MSIRLTHVADAFALWQDLLWRNIPACCRVSLSKNCKVIVIVEALLTFKVRFGPHTFLERSVTKFGISQDQLFRAVPNPFQNDCRLRYRFIAHLPLNSSKLLPLFPHGMPQSCRHAMFQ